MLTRARVGVRAAKDNLRPWEGLRESGNRNPRRILQVVVTSMADGLGGIKEANQTSGRAQIAVHAKNNSRIAYRFVKRTFDIVFSSAVIVMGFIPGAILSAAIAIDTEGSPIYSQERVGWSIIGQKSGAAIGIASRPALSALEAFFLRHLQFETGVAA